jgi:hypothetical protein
MMSLASRMMQMIKGWAKKEPEKEPDEANTFGPLIPVPLFSIGETVLILDKPESTKGTIIRKYPASVDCQVKVGLQLQVWEVPMSRIRKL